MAKRIGRFTAEGLRKALLALTAFALAAGLMLNLGGCARQAPLLTGARLGGTELPAGADRIQLLKHSEAKRVRPHQSGVARQNDETLRRLMQILQSLDEKHLRSAKAGSSQDAEPRLAAASKRNLTFGGRSSDRDGGRIEQQGEPTRSIIPSQQDRSNDETVKRLMAIVQSLNEERAGEELEPVPLLESGSDSVRPGLALLSPIASAESQEPPSREAIVSPAPTEVASTSGVASSTPFASERRELKVQKAPKVKQSHKSPDSFPSSSNLQQVSRPSAAEGSLPQVVTTTLSPSGARRSSEEGEFGYDRDKAKPVGQNRLSRPDHSEEKQSRLRRAEIVSAVQTRGSYAMLAGALSVLALGAVGFVYVVYSKGSRRQKRGRKPRFEREFDPVSGRPVAPAMPVVLVEGDYGVIARGLADGVRTGDLLLVGRGGEGAEHGIGVARVLKVHDCLSGFKLVERWFDTELRVGDLTRKAPAGGF